MGVLTDQMEALTNGILAATLERRAAVAEMRESTARVLGQARVRLSEIGHARRDRSEDLTRELREAARTMAAKVGGLLSEFDGAQAQRAAELGRFLVSHREARTEELNALFEELSRVRAAMAREFAVDIRGLVNQIQTGMSRFLSDTRAARGEATEAVRDRTTEALSTLHDRVAALVQETVDYLDRCERAHRDMAEQLHGTLSQNRQATQDQVKALLDGFCEARQRIGEDLRAAAQLWGRITFAKALAPIASDGRPVSSPQAVKPDQEPAHPAAATEPQEAKPKKKPRKKPVAD